MRTQNAERLLAGIVAVALVAPAAAGATADPQFEETSKRYELANGEISVWFQGKKPLLKVFPSDNQSRSYQFHMLRVAEFQDQDGDHAFDENESVAFVNLARADAYNVTTRSEAGAVHVALNINTTIQDRGGPDLGGTPQPPLGDEARANITLRFHVFGENRTLDTAGGNVTVTPGEVKFDVEVHRWDWRTQDGHLAFVGELPAGNGTQAEAQGGNRIAVKQNGTTFGYTAWQDAAQVTTENGTRTVDVVPSVKEQENGTVQVAWAYNATGFRNLIHDPTMGVTDASKETSDEGSLVGDVSDVPGPGVAAALAAALGAAVARRREF